MKTLNEDAFDDESKAPIVKDNYNIIYGETGWTDALDDATLELLVKAGIVRLVRTIGSFAFETRVYESVKARGAV